MRRSRRFISGCWDESVPFGDRWFAPHNRSMNKELLAKIAGDVQKSGFASEMKAIRHFLEHSWRGCQPGIYMDRELGLSREIDLVALKTPIMELTKDTARLFEYSILGEVKKSERPWIIFCHEMRKEGAGDGHSNYFFGRNLQFDADKLYELLEATSLGKAVGWAGTSIHEAFKSPDQPSRWYSACVSLIKAAEAHGMYGAEDTTEMEKPFHRQGNFYLGLTRPLIILDGLLVRAMLDKRLEVILKEVQHAVLKFNYHSSKYEEGWHSIDIVTLKGLGKYLEIVEDRICKVAALCNTLTN